MKNWLVAFTKTLVTNKRREKPKETTSCSSTRRKPSKASFLQLQTPNYSHILSLYQHIPMKIWSSSFCISFGFAFRFHQKLEPLQPGWAPGPVTPGRPGAGATAAWPSGRQWHLGALAGHGVGPLETWDHPRLWKTWGRGWIRKASGAEEQGRICLNSRLGQESGRRAGKEEEDEERKRKRRKNAKRTKRTKGTKGTKRKKRTKRTKRKKMRKMRKRTGRSGREDSS